MVDSPKLFLSPFVGMQWPQKSRQKLTWVQIEQQEVNDVWKRRWVWFVEHALEE